MALDASICLKLILDRKSTNLAVTVIDDANGAEACSVGNINTQIDYDSMVSAEKSDFESKRFASE